MGDYMNDHTQIKSARPARLIFGYPVRRLLKYIIGLGLFGLACLFIGSFLYGKNQERLFPPIGKIVKLNGVDIHYVDTGEVRSPNNEYDDNKYDDNKYDNNEYKAPIILIHGATTNLRDMKIALGDEIAKTRRVIMVDRAGHGYSERPKNGYRLDVQSGLIHDLADHLGLQKPILLGQSFGGVTALNYALEFPNDVSALVLIAPVSHEWEGGIEPYRRLAVNPLFGPIARRSVMPLYGHFKGPEIIRKAFEPQIVPNTYYTNAATPLLYRADHFYYDSQDITQLLPQIKAMVPQYPSLTLPVKIIVGLDDTSLKPKNHAIKLDQELPNSSLTVLENIGHPAHHDTLSIVQADLEALDVVLSQQ